MPKIAPLIDKYKEWPVAPGWVVADENAELDAERSKIRAVHDYAVRKRAPGVTNPDNVHELMLALDSDRVTPFVRHRIHWEGDCIVRLMQPPKGAKARSRPYLDYDGEVVYMSRIRRTEYKFLIDNVNQALHVNIRVLQPKDFLSDMYSIVVSKRD